MCIMCWNISGECAPLPGCPGSQFTITPLGTSAELNNLKQENERLKSLHLDEMKKSTDKGDEICKLVARVIELENGLGAQQKENERLKAENEKLEKKNHDLNWLKNRNNSQIDGLIEHNKYLLEKYNFFRKENEQLKAQLEQSTCGEHCEVSGVKLDSKPQPLEIKIQCDKCKQYVEKLGSYTSTILCQDCDSKSKPVSNIIAETVFNYLKEAVKTNENLAERKPHKCIFCEGEGYVIGWPYRSIFFNCEKCKGTGVLWE